MILEPFFFISFLFYFIFQGKIKFLSLIHKPRGVKPHEILYLTFPCKKWSDGLMLSDLLTFFSSVFLHNGLI